KSFRRPPAERNSGLPVLVRQRVKICDSGVRRRPLRSEDPQSMHRSARHHPRVEFDLAECAFVAPDVLLKDAEESLRLLRAQVDALEVLDFNLGLALLQQS